MRSGRAISTTSTLFPTLSNLKKLRRSGTRRTKILILISNSTLRRKNLQQQEDKLVAQILALTDMELMAEQVKSRLNNLQALELTKLCLTSKEFNSSYGWSLYWQSSLVSTLTIWPLLPLFVVSWEEQESLNSTWHTYKARCWMRTSNCLVIQQSPRWLVAWISLCMCPWWSMLLSSAVRFPAPILLLDPSASFLN